MNHDEAKVVYLELRLSVVTELASGSFGQRQPANSGVEAQLQAPVLILVTTGRQFIDRL